MLKFYIIIIYDINLRFKLKIISLKKNNYVKADLPSMLFFCHFFNFH
jgi:hypothetical protein